MDKLCRAPEGPSRADRRQGRVGEETAQLAGGDDGQVRADVSSLPPPTSLTSGKTLNTLNFSLLSNGDKKNLNEFL